MKAYVWKDEMGNVVEITDIKEGDEHYDTAIAEREKLLENLANLDDNFAVRREENGGKLNL